MATLAELRTRIKQRTDNEHSGSNYLPASELLGLINRSYEELYGILLKSGLDSIPESTTTITGTGARNYALPDDFFSVIGVYHVVNGQYRPLPRHNARKYPHDTTTAYPDSYRTFGLRTGAQIQFDPIAASGSYLVLYHPAPTELSADADIVDGVLGWDEYIVCDVAVKILVKEGAPPHIVGAVRAQKDELGDRIRAEAALRDMSEHASVQDVRGTVVGTSLPGDWGVRGYRGSF